MKKIIFLNQNSILTSLNNLESSLENDLHLMPAISHFFNIIKSELNFEMILYFFHDQKLLSKQDYEINKTNFLNLCKQNGIEFDGILALNIELITLENHFNFQNINIKDSWLIGRSQADLDLAKNINVKSIIINSTPKVSFNSIPLDLVDDWSEVLDLVQKN